jgi:alkanesulfonate monooxygenase SsuD/methylene tetrahydromethanopterin reductase-like flavin-dependent oxidoreductase (luciferase family)
MGDYGRKLEFGISVEPLAEPPGQASGIVRAADRAGLDLAGIQDHPYQRRFLDTWTLISTLVPQTGNIRFFPDVANLPLRPPAMLAKAAASLDVLSGGRVEIGLGAGAFWDAIVAMDGPRRSPRDAVKSTEEAIHVMHLVWSEERSARFEGEFYSLRGMHPGPRPAHDIGIWIGAYGPKMLDLTGRLANGWLPSLGRLDPNRLPEMQHRVDDAASGADREPSEIRRALNISGNIGLEGDGFLEGSVSKWVGQLSRLVLEIGIDTFIYWPSGDQEHQVELFAGEVAPAVRESVEKERGGGAASQ